MVYLLGRSDFELGRDFCAAQVAISDLLHRGSAGAPRPTDALAAGPGGGGDRPVVGRTAIPTASDLTRTKVRDLIDGFAEPFLDGSSKPVARWFTDPHCTPPSPRKPSRKVPAVPRACIKQEFGARKPLAATLPTDWGTPPRCKTGVPPRESKKSFVHAWWLVEQREGFLESI